MKSPPPLSSSDGATTPRRSLRPPCPKSPASWMKEREEADENSAHGSQNDEDGPSTLYPPGTRVYKLFDAGWYWGSITGVRYDNGDPMYYIVYDDQDEEEQTQEEIVILVRQAVEAEAQDNSSNSDTGSHSSPSATRDIPPTRKRSAAAGKTKPTKVAKTEVASSYHRQGLTGSTSPSTTSRNHPKRRAAQNICYSVDSDDDEYKDDESDEDGDAFVDKSSRTKSKATTGTAAASTSTTARRTSPRASAASKPRRVMKDYSSGSDVEFQDDDETEEELDDFDMDNAAIVMEEEEESDDGDRKPAAKKSTPAPTTNAKSKTKAKVDKVASTARPKKSDATESMFSPKVEQRLATLIAAIRYDAAYETTSSAAHANFNDSFLDDSNSATPVKPEKAKTDQDALDEEAATAADKKKTKGKKNANGLTVGYEKAPYSAGDHLPLVSDIPLMFDDMVREQLLSKGNNHATRLVGLLQKLHNRPLRIATMCSGTESPILALDMLQTAVRDACRDVLSSDRNVAEALNGMTIGTLFPMEHVFSCEIEPFKQAYIERNFGPPLLFRDIRELGRDEAQTAYGSTVPVPHEPGDVDVLIAGTSCVDYSNLNNQKKTMDEEGESGATFFGMIRWIKRAKPPIVIIENVYGAPWDQKVKAFEEAGYVATYMHLDTKDYYIPHTRQRGYLVAIRKSSKKKSKASELPAQWKQLMTSLKRPASATLDDFMLPNDDPRVLRGRARLTAESLAKDSDSAGRVDWTKCETRHQTSRSLEELGDKRPLTDWSDAGNTAMPSFCWNEWVNAQVHRIHDLMDVNMLRLAQAGLDCTHLVMVWNLSQNVDRDTMGKLGLCQCLTPTGVPYVTNRGGPLVGEELLMLQGIPVDDLLFTKETEDNLKDLAGNAMSTTVVGACLLSALLVGYEALPSRAIPSTSNSPSLVPRPMTVPSNIVLSHDFGQYERTAAKLSPSLFTLNTWKSFLDSAYKSRRLCISEGPDESIPLDSILQCRECGHTSCTANAMPPRKFEKHDFDAVQGLDCRVEPATFRRELLSLLPMRIVICGLDIDVAQLTKPESVETSVWTSWLDSTASAMGSSNEYRFIHVVRSHIWTAVYRNRSMARLEARVSKLGVTWYLFSPNPPKIGAQSVELPMARLVVKPDTKNFTVTDGVWEVCLPVTTEIPITITNTGVSVPSWRKRLGLKGRFEDEMESEKLRITIDSDSEETSDLKANVDGCYRLLPDCGGACGSLRKKEDCSGKDMFFFLSAGRASLAKDNCYVLSPTCHRTSYGEFRSISLHIESDFSPISPYGSVARSSKTVNAFVHGKWVPLENATTKTSVNDRMELLVPKSKLNVPFSQSGYKVCPVLVESKVTVGIGDDLLAGCSNVGGLAELNLQKSKKLLADVAFATSRLRLPSSMENGEWLGLKLCGQMREEEWICRKCAPIKPSLRWTTATKSNRTVFVPIEDGKEAAVYERALKARPHPWLFRIGASSATELSLTIGCNPCSLAQRAFGLFSSSTLARNTWLTSASTSSNDSVFDWRVVLHSEATFTGFPALRLTSNKHNDEAGQPPNFKAHPLRKEQLRSLTWMLDQEATNDPFVEEEVTEAVLPSLNWRAEGRARRPVLVRGGIIADAVGYGKTAITLGLIDSTATKLRAAPEVPNSYRQGFVSTKATLVVVPKHLMGQWPDEVKKFLGSSKKVVIVKDLSTWERLKICEVVDADIVLVSFEVLMHEKYLTNLVFMCGLDLASLPRGTGGGRHYTFVYNSCLEVLPERVEMIRKDRTSAIKDIQDACKRNASAENAQKIQLDGKKAAYNNGKAATKSKVSKPAIANRDPWGLSKRETKDDFAQMTCPPLEMFFWNRLVVDEFTYLSKKKDRERLLEFTYNLKSSFRWFLSGTPDHSDFNDVNNLARFLGIHLGIDEVLPGVKLSKKYLADRESTGLESLSHYLESRSLPWHHRRHDLCQAFLDRFVRQNVAEIGEIDYEEIIRHVILPAPEIAIYTELETHLESLDMNSKNAQKGKRKNGGDRETRMDTILQGSQTGEEALLKCCSHYNMSGSSTALETLDSIVSDRKEQKFGLARDMTKELVAAFHLRSSILKLQPEWSTSVTLTGKGEVLDALGVYLKDVEKNDSIFPRADGEVNEFIHRIAKNAKGVFHELTGEGKTQKRKRDSDYDVDDDVLAELLPDKIRLRNHMHKVRALGKELSGRIRSLRYIENIRKAQEGGTQLVCAMCSRDNSKVAFGVLSCCGHNGCLDCLQKEAMNGHCVMKDCSAHVSSAQIVATDRFAFDRANESTETFGRKLTEVVDKVKEIISLKDRLIVFCQFDDLIGKVKEALAASDVASLEVKGNVGQQIRTVALFQKSVPGKSDPRVLLLKMDDEQSAGLNLTNLNHAIFVHPLSATTQQDYDAYETQAIGRIRRYGQRKKVHIWRFLATDTIDTKIYQQRTAAAAAKET